MKGRLTLGEILRGYAAATPIFLVQYASFGEKCLFQGQNFVPCFEFVRYEVGKNDVSFQRGILCIDISVS